LKRLTIALILIACSAAATGQTITGAVKNGTTRKPAAGVDVILVKLTQGMDEVSKTKTNAQGEFTLKVPDPSANHMVRVRFQDVYYNAQIPPGVKTAQITVYNSAPTVPEIQLIDYSQVFETEGGLLKGIEVFNLRNISNPPVTQPAFSFYLPEGAEVRLGQAVSSGGMPVPVEATRLPEKNKYQIIYPLRPGSIRVEIVYTVPYSGSFKLEPKLPMPTGKFYAVMPRTMTFKPAGGAAFHADRWPMIEPTIDMNTNAVDSPAPGQSLAYEISGAGQIPDAPSAQQQPPQPQPGGTRQGPGGGLGTPNEKPNPISSGQFAFLGVMTIFLAAGAAFIFMQTPNAPVLAAAPSKGGGSLLDALKEEMFQLEADRVKGKVSAQEYESAKGALDKTLQRAMKHK